MLLGHGFGGGFGFLGMLLQIVLIGGAVMLALRYFANRRQPSYGVGGQSQSYNMSPTNKSSFQIPTIGSGAVSAGSRAAIVRAMRSGWRRPISISSRNC